MARTLTQVKNNTNPLINSVIDRMTTADEAMLALASRIQITGRTHIKGQRDVDETSALVYGCSDSITPAPLSGADYSYDMELVGSPFDICYTVEADELAAEREKNILVAARRVAEKISALAIADIEGQLTKTAAAVGATFALEDLDNMYAAVINKSPGNLVYLGSAAAVNEIMSDMRSSLGGVNYTEFAGLTLPFYRSAPILTTNHMTANKIVALDLESWDGYINRPMGEPITEFMSLVDRGAGSGPTNEYFVHSLFTSVVNSTRNVVARTHS